MLCFTKLPALHHGHNLGAELSPQKGVGSSAWVQKSREAGTDLSQGNMAALSFLSREAALVLTALPQRGKYL